ncbi:MAG: hypothetical protein V4690_01380 [Patescibacteria group bacterium]
MGELFAGLLAFFAFGTVAFWILFAAAWILMGVFVENDWPGYTTISFVVITLVLYYAGVLQFSWIIQNPLQASFYFLSYFVIGAVWAVGKWWRFVTRIFERYDDIRREFLKLRGVEGNKVPDAFKKEWLDHIRRETDYGREVKLKIGNNGVVHPSPNEHKSEIYLWILFWPWSVVGYFLDEPLKKLVRWIYRRISTLLEKISLNVFKSTKDDFFENPTRSDR